jgi:hypothetical protein
MKPKHVADEPLARGLYERQFAELPFGDPQPPLPPPRPAPLKERPHNPNANCTARGVALVRNPFPSTKQENPK